MDRIKIMLTLAGVVLCAVNAWPQLVVVHDPNKDAKETKLTAAEQRIFDRDALPAVRKMIKSEVCEESLQDAGVVRGAFTAAGKRQSLIFYEYCQTGNGFGWNGLVLIEGDKVVGNFVSEGGWGVNIGSVPDINRNGILEFTLAYSGGLHQGAGGTGVDLMEFLNGLPKGIGWYKAEAFGETEASTSWKLTAKPGKAPVFYKQKFFSGENRPPRAVGKSAVTKLKSIWVSKFEHVK
jgi:hypothetical protein